MVTEVKIEKSKWNINKESGILMLGSCFTTNIGEELKRDGYNVLVNPFGVLFNPASIACAFNRFITAEPYNEADVINIGLHTTEPNGDEKRLPEDRFCSFYHHSSLARESGREFLCNANSILERSSEFLRNANTVIITLGTSWVFRHIRRDFIVSNCHKINPKEFRREFLPIESTAAFLSEMAGAFPEKHFIFTVSPIRHFKDGAHGNRISKASLLIAIDNVLKSCGNVEYFPSYEIMLDELRDYRYYAEDLVHPSDEAIKYIYARFRATYCPI